MPKAKITGTFIDFGVEFGTPSPRYPDRMLQPGFWERELADRREAGLTDVILARIMELGRTHYHSELFQEWDAQDHVALIMAAAAALDMNVWLGGHLNLAFWDRIWDFSRMMRRDRRVNEFIFRELWGRYAGHPALAGHWAGQWAGCR